MLFSLSLFAQRKMTPLMEALEKKDSKRAIELINSGADINTKDRMGETPLIEAAEEGLTEVVSLLIEKKADIIKYLKNPETNAKQLRNASIYLYEVSAQYRRIVNYFAHMCPLPYIMYPAYFPPLLFLLFILYYILHNLSTFRIYKI